MLQKLETEKVLVYHLILQEFLTQPARFSPGAESDTELHHTGGKSGLAGIPGDCCFRDIHFFHSLMGLSTVSRSHCHSCPLLASSAEGYGRQCLRGKAAGAEG